MATVLITGANSGVGLELAKQMLAQGKRVITLTRSALPEDEAVIAAAIGAGQLVSYRGDLADVRSREAALDEIVARESAIDVVFNNAGISLGRPTLSPQQRDIHFEVNTLAPYAVLDRLKPLLLRGQGRLVVNTGSNAGLLVKTLDPARLERPTSFKKLFGPYATSKLALALWTADIAAELEAEGIRILSVCPGANKTPMTAADGMPGWLLPIRHLFFPHPRSGAARLERAAFAVPAHPAGSFINKDVPTRLPFAARSGEVLALVRQVLGDELTGSDKAP